jgi:RNAse (barnase) inhibitor barstar
MQTIIIDGRNFSDVESFYSEVDLKLTKGLDWKTGHNLNAFIDLLCGGFGVFDYQEKIILEWINFSDSKTKLGKDFIDNVCSIVEDHQHIIFVTQD